MKFRNRFSFPSIDTFFHCAIIAGALALVGLVLASPDLMAALV